MNFVKTVISLAIVIATVLSNAAIVKIANEDATVKETALSTESFNYSVKGAYLVEASTGTVLFGFNETESCQIASVTKVMTLLLVMEAVDGGKINLNDKVIISRRAASMGGSQVYLEEGEQITVDELIKCAVIASANDASVALAELVFGSEDLFVKKMNEKAQQLGLENTYFENTTGLDDTTTNHHSCPKDVATISRELVKYELILKYSSTWQDSIRNGEMTLTNTNRLIRYYDGCNGLKTGSTDKAGFCISVTAKRGNMQLIAVILGANTKDERNAAARYLLDYGFANYMLYESPEGYLENAYVRGGKTDSATLKKTGFSAVIDKSEGGSVEEIYDIPEYLIAPTKEGQTVGNIVYKIGDKIIGESQIYVESDIERIGIFNVMGRIIRKIIAGT